MWCSTRPVSVHTVFLCKSNFSVLVKTAHDTNLNVSWICSSQCRINQNMSSLVKSARRCAPISTSYTTSCRLEVVIFQVLLTNFLQQQQKSTDIFSLTTTATSACWQLPIMYKIRKHGKQRANSALTILTGALRFYFTIRLLLCLSLVSFFISLPWQQRESWRNGGRESGDKSPRCHVAPSNPAF